MPKKITPAEYEQWLLDDGRGIVALEPYVTSKTKIMHQCRYGHEPWSVKPNDIRNGYGCPHCAGKIPQDYREWLTENRPDITALETYVTRHTKIMHQCSKGHKWSAAPKGIKSGNGCPHCDVETRGIHPKGYWTLERCMEDARRYGTRRDWHLGKSAGYYTARQKGWLEHCCAQMESGYSASDADAIYFWEWTENGVGTGIYKPGVTSWRRGDARIVQCAATNGIDYRLIALCETSPGDALQFERMLLDMGDTVALPDHITDGRTEFRIYSEQELQFIYELLGVSESALAMAA